MATMTWDRFAVDALIHKRADAEIEAMARFAAKHLAILTGRECPACGSTDIEHAGEEGAVCAACWHQWDYADWKIVEIGDDIYPVGT